MSFWIEGVCIPTVSIFGLGGKWKDYILRIKSVVEMTLASLNAALNPQMSSLYI